MGGLRFKNTEKIDIQNVKTTLEFALFRIFENVNDYTHVLIGSYKKPIQNDIDVAIVLHKHTFDEFAELVSGAYDKKSFNYNKGLNVLSLRTGVINKNTLMPLGPDKFVQIDFMLFDNKNLLPLASFLYKGIYPGESKYSGSYRTSLMYHTLRYITSTEDSNLEETYFNDEFNGKFKGQIKTYKKYSLRPNGLVIQHKSYVGKTTKIKTPKKISEDILVSINPDEIVKILSRGKFTVEDFDTFESILELTKNGLISKRFDYSNFVTSYCDTYLPDKNNIPTEFTTILALNSI